MGKEQKAEYFKIETLSLLNEVVDCAMPKTMGVLKVPLNIFKNYLAYIAQRCSEINDPVLNKIMCDMALYEQASRYSKSYNPEMLEQVDKNYEEYLKKRKEETK